MAVGVCFWVELTRPKNYYTVIVLVYCNLNFVFPFVTKKLLACLTQLTCHCGDLYNFYRVRPVHIEIFFYEKWYRLVFDIRRPGFCIFVQYHENDFLPLNTRYITCVSFFFDSWTKTSRCRFSLFEKKSLCPSNLTPTPIVVGRLSTRRTIVPFRGPGPKLNVGFRGL